MANTLPRASSSTPQLDFTTAHLLESYFHASPLTYFNDPILFPLYPSTLLNTMTPNEVYLSSIVRTFFIIPSLVSHPPAAPLHVLPCHTLNHTHPLLCQSITTLSSSASPTDKLSGKVASVYLDRNASSSCDRSQEFGASQRSIETPRGRSDRTRPCDALECIVFIVKSTRSLACCKLLFDRSRRFAAIALGQGFHNRMMINLLFYVKRGENV